MKNLATDISKQEYNIEQELSPFIYKVLRNNDALDLYEKIISKAEFNIDDYYRLTRLEITILGKLVEIYRNTNGINKNISFEPTVHLPFHFLYTEKGSKKAIKETIDYFDKIRNNIDSSPVFYFSLDSWITPNPKNFYTALEHLVSELKSNIKFFLISPKEKELFKILDDNNSSDRFIRLLDEKIISYVSASADTCKIIDKVSKANLCLNVSVNSSEEYFLHIPKIKNITLLKAHSKHAVSEISNHKNSPYASNYIKTISILRLVSSPEQRILIPLEKVGIPLASLAVEYGADSISNVALDLNTSNLLKIPTYSDVECFLEQKSIKYKIVKQ